MEGRGLNRTISSVVAGVALALAAGAACAQAEAPKYGGNLEIGSMYPTISALSWDLADWNWKQNYDTGQVYEQLFAADLSKARRNGGKYPHFAFESKKKFYDFH